MHMRTTWTKGDLSTKEPVQSVRMRPAHLAGPAAEYGATLYSTDNDFSRFDFGKTDQPDGELIFSMRKGSSKNYFEDCK